MQTYQLRMTSPFINPTWLRKVGGNHDTIVLPDGTINLEGETLVFKDATLPPNTAVKVWLDRDFVCATQEAIKEREQQRLLKQEQEEQDYRDKCNRYRDESISFNSSIGLPAKWDVGIKHVLSGLSASSMGNGVNRATVMHIILLEDLESGRIKRSKGSFLCSTNPQQDGMQYIGYEASGGVSESYEYFVDGEGHKYQPKVTCKTCLQVAEHIKAQKLKQDQQVVEAVSKGRKR